MFMRGHVVSVRPKKYFTQSRGYCGAYTLKGVLSAWGLDDKKHPKDYLSLFMRPTQATLPSTISSQLRKHGFDAHVKRANKFSDVEKIAFLKNEIDNDRPVILLESTSFTRENKLRQRPFYGNVGHWISVWGYDDKSFFVYDSFIEKKHYSEVPIGNASRTFEQIIQTWKGPPFLRMFSYLYVPVIKNK